MGKYQAYPEYKGSGVEWVGQVPKHWSLIKGGYIGSVFGSEPISEDLVVDEGILPFIKVSDLSSNGLGCDSFQWFVEKSKAKSCRKQKNYIVFPKRGAAIFTNKVNIITVDSIIDPNLMGWKISNIGIVKFIALLLKSRGLKDIADVSTVPQINAKHILPEKFPIPPVAEQQQIANFLDHETAKIDTLIEKQQQLIKLLKEKRQAVISHAVTKGLNPNAPMRDSGVEWLGAIPKGWKMVPLKHLCKFSGGGTPSKDNLVYWDGGDIPWVSPKDMKLFWLSDTQDKLTETAVKQSSTKFIEPYSLLMVVRSGILQRTIPIAINAVQVTLNQDMKALKFDPEINVEFAANYVLGNTKSLLLDWSKEGATVESIEHEFLSASKFPVPSVREQKEINEYFVRRKISFCN